MKIYQVLSSLSLSDKGIYLGDDRFKTDMGIAILHPSKRTHWIAYINEFCLIITVGLLLRNYLNL